MGRALKSLYLEIIFNSYLDWMRAQISLGSGQDKIELALLLSSCKICGALANLSFFLMASGKAQGIGRALPYLILKGS